MLIAKLYVVLKLVVPLTL